MKASLISRETIADSIELAVQGHQLDGVICIVGCDKTIPAAAMALARMDLPGCVLYGGTIMPGRHGGKDISIQEVFEAIGAHGAGSLDDEGLTPSRKRRLSGRWRMRRSVHRQHHGDGPHGDGPLTYGRQ